MMSAKSTFCEAFNAVYREELDVAPNEDGLFYKITAAPPKYPGVFTVMISRTHPAAQYCLCMKSGVHKRSTKTRTYTVNVNTGKVSQKCWAAQCMNRENKGRMILVDADVMTSEDEEESEDEEAVAKFQTSMVTTNKKRKTM